MAKIKDNKLPEADKAQAGIFMTDADALLRDYGNLARGIARRYRGRGLPLEDLHQEALLGLLQAAKSYRDRGASFATYAVYWIKKRILAALEQEGITCLDSESLPEKSFEQVVDTSARSADVVRFELPDELPLPERQVLELSFARELSLKEVAAQMGLTVERVKQLRCKAVRRVRQLYHGQANRLSDTWAELIFPNS